jgi:hypothetical protein
MLADDDNWTLVSNYLGGPLKPGEPWPTFAQETYLVSTDGSMRVRRLFHCQTVYSSYWDCPRSVISRDGRFITFTSNWGSGHRGVFIARVPEALVPKKP